MPADNAALRKAIALSFAMVLLGSTAVAATRLASDHASTAAIITVQYLICTLLCMPRILRAGWHNLGTQRLGLHFLRGLVGVVGFYLFYLAIQNIPLVDAMLLRQSAPLLVPLTVWLWLGERITPRAWLPLCVGFVGIAVILRPSPQGMSWWHAAGLFSAAALAISMVTTRKLASTEPSHRILFYYSVLSLACVAPISVGDYREIALPGWLAMVYIGIAIYWTLELYNRAYGMAPTAAIAPINYFSVILAGFWGWLFWDQVPDLWSLLGSMLVIAGGLLTIRFAHQG